eukprot:NODE_962_length_644_cov_45.690756_g890_i0.p2 GENE.NODE_962_length_644_cov_45.690756_g890_i0~~NODE_962_length_644_cov_45.690756_g890_i0.p2  ORF type:complete len:96 (+),score=10.06 NODE_962_length_644_cov_45.690756_g890_i0:184-471(+)
MGVYSCKDYFQIRSKNRKKTTGKNRKKKQNRKYLLVHDPLLVPFCPVLFRPLCLQPSVPPLPISVRYSCIKCVHECGVMEYIWARVGLGWNVCRT